MKLLMRMVLVLIFSLAPQTVGAVVYVEYTEEMASILSKSDENEARVFLDSIIGAEGVTHLFGGATPKMSTKKNAAVKEKGVEALLECFSEDRLEDRCDANNHLERSPQKDHSFSFQFLGSIKEPLGNVEVIFTSYTHKMKDLGRYLKKINRPFYFYHYQTKQKENLFHLSFKSKDNMALLVGMHTFNRNNTSFITCRTGCDYKKHVDFFHKCLNGTYPGFVEKIGWEYPDRKVLSKYIVCPSHLHPPVPGLSPDLKQFTIPMPMQVFYLRLNQCISAVTGTPIEDPEEWEEFRFRMVLTVYRANPAAFKALPHAVADMLLYVADEAEDLYLTPINMTMPLRISECE